MKESGFVRGITMGLVAAAAMVMSVDTAQAQSKTTSPLFPNGLSGVDRSRMFMRLGYTSTFNKSKSGEVYDVTGPVATRDEINAAFEKLKAITSTSDPYFNGDVSFGDDLSVSAGAYNLAQQAIITYMDNNNIKSIGVPSGIKATVGNAGTPTVSLGYWLDEDYKWTVEAFLLAAPLTVKAYGAGINPSGKPNGVSGKEVISTKMLPPLAILAYNFGTKNSVVRPYVGVGATYAIFFDTKATEAFNTYAGGTTSVSLKNSFAVGPFLGMQSQLSDSWHVNVSVGQLKLKTTATMVTSDTRIQSGDAVLFDYQRGLVSALTTRAEGNWLGSPDKGMTTAVMETIAMTRNGNSSLDGGSYVRKQNQVITSTILTVSVGYNF